MMTRKIHQFDNGVKVYDDHLLAVQRKRYAQRNVHEAEEEDIFLAIMKVIPAEGCFVNIGSAIGYYSILARTLLPRLEIHAVEPLASHRKCFLENIALNGLKSSDFSIHEQGVSGTVGQASLVDLNYSSFILDGALDATILGQIRAKGWAIKPVEVITLDMLYERIGRRIDLLQMDVQGVELEVLRGGVNCLKGGGVTTLLIGSHSQDLHRGCIEFLTGLGYVIEFENADTKEQPDGIIVASYGERRLNLA